MSSLVAFVLGLICLAALALAAAIRILRRPLWSRLVLVAILTRIFDRPEAKGRLRS